VDGQLNLPDLKLLSQMVIISLQLPNLGLECKMCARGNGLSLGCGFADFVFVVL
jgi:hypothetical protein